tara:strand:- start:277 stop:459 length:183 start_codon:yes stop_codon:yes gene_type:complete
MYCGASLEAQQRFSTEEKQEILESKQKLSKELKDKTLATSKRINGSAFFTGGDLGGGGDC